MFCRRESTYPVAVEVGFASKLQLHIGIDGYDMYGRNILHTPIGHVCLGEVEPVRPPLFCDFRLDSVTREGRPWPPGGEHRSLPLSLLSSLSRLFLIDNVHSIYRRTSFIGVECQV